MARARITVAPSFVQRVVQRVGVLLLLLAVCAACGKSSSENQRVQTVDLASLRLEMLDSFAPSEARLLSREEIAPCAGDSGNGPEIILEYSYGGSRDQLLDRYRLGLTEKGWHLVDSYRINPTADGLSLVFDKRTSRGPLRSEVRWLQKPGSTFEVLVYSTMTKCDAS